MLRIFRDDSSALRAFREDGFVVRTFKEYVMPYLSPNKTSRAYAPNTSSWPRAPSVVPALCRDLLNSLVSLIRFALRSRIHAAHFPG